MAPGVLVIKATVMELVMHRSPNLGSSPCSQHLDQMLFSGARFFAFPQPGENAILLQQCSTGGSLDVDHFHLLNVLSRWDSVKIEVLAEYYNAGSVLEHIAGVARHWLYWHSVWCHWVALARLFFRRLWDCLRNMSEELQHVLK